LVAEPNDVRCPTWHQTGYGFTVNVWLACVDAGDAAGMVRRAQPLADLSLPMQIAALSR